MSLDIGRLVWNAADEQGQARLSLQWVRDAGRVSHLDLLQDWIADLEAKYDACFIGMPNWHAMTWADREEINKASAEYNATLPHP